VSSAWTYWAESRTEAKTVLSDIIADGDFCNSVYGINRKPKDGSCHRHDISNDAETVQSLLLVPCGVQFEQVRFQGNIGLEFVIVRGLHPHPPPPRAKLSRAVQGQMLDYLQRHPNATAMGVMTASDLWGDAKSAITVHPGAGNLDTVQRVISEFRVSKHGDGFEGVLSTLLSQAKDQQGPYRSFEGYVQGLHTFADGHAFVVCCLLNHYERLLFARMRCAETDVYFKQLRGLTSLSISTWDAEGKLQVVLVRSNQSICNENSPVRNTANA
jgi:hypothetical protein